MTSRGVFVASMVVLLFASGIEDGVIARNAQVMSDALREDPRSGPLVLCRRLFAKTPGPVLCLVLGFEDVRVYDGSWLEWGSGGYPVETD